MYRQLKINRSGKLYAAVKRCYDQVLHGRVLVIDPSIGSSGPTGSLPGYACQWPDSERNRMVIDSGVIQVPMVRDTYTRLYEIGRTLREEFTAMDVLVIESVPAKRWKQAGNFRFGSVKQQVQLHRATGAVLASVKAGEVLWVPPQTWHCVTPEGYIKSDEGDALCMLEAVRQYALAVQEDLLKGRKKKPRAGLDKDGLPKVKKGKKK